MIREYRQQDLDRVLQIWYEASKIAHSFLADELLQGQKIEIRDKYIPMAETWVMEHGGVIQGFISLLDSYVGGLFIHPDFQREGAGKALVQKARAEKGELSVGVYDKNVTAHRFYREMGFCETGREVQMGTGETVINMILMSETK